MSRGVLLPLLAGLLSGCAVVPNAVVAVPKSTTKPLYQVDRLEAARGSKIRWGFVNDQATATEIRFEFATKIFEDSMPFLCGWVNATTHKRSSSKNTQRAGGASPTFKLPAATDVGPSVCVFTLTVLEGVEAKEYPYSIYQDNVLKQDPVIIIR